MRTITVVGASLAGLEAARTLRAEGFGDRLIVVGEEPHAPYDRPPLSKGFLDRTVAQPDLALAELSDVELRIGVGATRLIPRERRVETSTGHSIRTDGVVIATGARARRLPSHLGPTQGLHVLRTLDDAVGLRGDLAPGKRMVVVGGGFIGAEVAATACTLGLEVTVVEAQPRLLLSQLGELLAAFLAGVHTDRGVRVLTGHPVAGIIGSNRVEAVRLADGTAVPADVVLVGIGTVPAVEWLECSGVEVADGVACDEAGRTNVPNVVAVGDCASWRGPTGTRLRRQHWTAALRQGTIGAAALLGSSASAATPTDLDYVWSDQYDLRLQIVGRPQPGYTTVPINATPSDGRFTMAFLDRQQVVRAIASVSDPRTFGRWRRRLGTQYTEEMAPA